jgi:hypothetical protein
MAKAGSPRKTTSLPRFGCRSISGSSSSSQPSALFYTVSSRGGLAIKFFSIEEVAATRSNCLWTFDLSITTPIVFTGVSRQRSGQRRNLRRVVCIMFGKKGSWVCGRSQAAGAERNPLGRALRSARGEVKQLAAG